VDTGGDNKAKKLSQTIHHISIQKQLLEHKNQGLREALVIQKKRSKQGRPLPLNQPDKYHSGAIF
jgi:hypothetical protein